MNTITIRLEDILEASQTILSAVDASTLSTITDTLEVNTENNKLYFAVTNKEYFVKVYLPMVCDVTFHATVNATTFLKLVSHMTTETVTLTVDDNILIVKGNGTYKLPMIYDDAVLLTIPEITISNITDTFNLDKSILDSIYFYNSKEIVKSVVAKPVQKLYYIDNKGCITFNTGACVNNFTLPTNIKLLINQRVVKLFKLFKDNTVKVEYGHDACGPDSVQTKLRITTDNIILAVILNNDQSLINSVPADIIRNRANEIYPYNVVLNKTELIQSINRLLLVTDTTNFNKPFGKFIFINDQVTIKCDNNEENLSTLNSNNNCDYSCFLDLNDLKSTLETCNTDCVNMCFGNSEAVVITRDSIFNIIPEVVEN